MHVVIAGGGVIGCAIAYYLSLKGVEVTIVEPHVIAGSASGKSGGFLARDWCRGQPQDALASLSFDLHDDLSRALPEDYGYRRVSTYAVATSDKRSLGREARDIPCWASGDCLVHQVIGTTETTAQLIPDRFTRALFQASLDRGANLVRASATGIVTDDTRMAVTGVRLGSQVLACDSFVVAMGPWSVLAAQWLSMPAVYGIKSNSVILDSAADTLPAEVFFVQYEDADGEYHDPELVLRTDGSAYVCGFSDETPLPIDPGAVTVDVAQGDRLAAVASKIGPLSPERPLLARQACYRPICEDAMPVMGAVEDIRGVFVATGHNCWGMLNAPGTGHVMADLIAEGRSDDLDLSPLRPHRLAPLHLESAG